MLLRETTRVLPSLVPLEGAYCIAPEYRDPQAPDTPVVSEAWVRTALRRQAGSEGLRLLLEVTEVVIVSDFRNLPGFACLINLDTQLLDLLT